MKIPKRVTPKWVEDLPHSGFLLRPTYAALNSLVRKDRVAMFHMGRSGSTVLGKMLNQHSQVFWASELFYKYRNINASDKEAFGMDKIIRSSRQRCSKVYGFETKYLSDQDLSDNQLEMSLEQYIAVLKHHGFNKFILLQRRNYLRVLISWVVARKDIKLHADREKKKPTQVSLDLDKVVFSEKPDMKYALPILEYFEKIDKRYEEIKQVLAPEDTLFMFYEEDILSDPLIAYKKVCDFLKISPENPDIALKRTNPHNIKDIVVNVEELNEVLSGTKYGWMLEDSSISINQ